MSTGQHADLVVSNIGWAITVDASRRVIRAYLSVRSGDARGRRLHGRRSRRDGDAAPGNYHPDATVRAVMGVGNGALAYPSATLQDQ